MKTITTKEEGSEMEKIKLSEKEHDFLIAWLSYQIDETGLLRSPQPIEELDQSILNFIALVHGVDLPDGYYWEWEGENYIFAEKDKF